MRKPDTAGRCCDRSSGAGHRSSGRAPSGRWRSESWKAGSLDSQPRRHAESTGDKPVMRLPNPLESIRRNPESPPELRDKTIVTVLGMHRSGTSAIAGMLADHGLEFGRVRERNRFNPRGNRELPELNELHEAVLERSGGSWWRPPAEVRVRPADLRRRNGILADIPGERIAVKDPRMLVCDELWEDLALKPIGVIRNPVAVTSSLARRARERPHKHPQLSAGEWEDVWITYNRELLAEHRRSPFPLIDFDRADQLDDRVAAALEFWGLERAGASGFFDPGLAAPVAEADWVSQVQRPESLELWRALAAIAAG